MSFTKKVEDKKMTICVRGKLNTMIAPEMDKEIKASIDGIKELVFDFSDADYISSAGLRVLTAAQITMSRQGRMIVTGVNDMIDEIFELTGLKNIFTIL